MDKYTEEKTIKTIYDLYADLQILYFALQSFDEDIELNSIFNGIERMYLKTKELNDFYLKNFL